MAIAFSQYALVDDNTGSATYDTSASSLNTTTGSTFVICVGHNDVRTITSIGDNKGNTYTLTVSGDETGAGQYGRIYRCENGTGGSGHYATVTFDSSTYVTMFFIEITGAATASYDVSASNVSFGDPSTVTTATLAQANELLISFLVVQNNNVWTPNDGFTKIADSNAVGWVDCAVGYKVVASTSAVTSTWSMVGARGYAALIASFKEGGGGGGGGGAPLMGQACL